MANHVELEKMHAVADLVEITYPKAGWTLANVPKKLTSEHRDFNRCIPVEQTPWWNHGRPSGSVKRPISPLLAQKAA
jgi:hypothetical protein